MRHPYAQYKSDGTIWRAGKSVYGLCAAWNHATSPSRLMTEAEHNRSNVYARAIRNRMERMGYRSKTHFTWLDSGIMWPTKP